jgi:hypothetical protein
MLATLGLDCVDVDDKEAGGKAGSNGLCRAYLRRGCYSAVFCWHFTSWNSKLPCLFAYCSRLGELLAVVD